MRDYWAFWNTERAAEIVTWALLLSVIVNLMSSVAGVRSQAAQAAREVKFGCLPGRRSVAMEVVENLRLGMGSDDDEEESVPMGTVLPTTEHQARPHAKLKDPNEQLDACANLSSPSGEPLGDARQGYRAGSWIVW